MTGAASLAAVLAGFLMLVFAVVILYNRLVRGRVLVREGFSGIDVQLKRRHNLIPNLVSTVKGYAAFERDVLEEVTRLRTRAVGDLTVAEKQRDENLLTGALKTLLAVVEKYPDLKADTHFLDLQRQLASIEDELQKARRYYNGTVRDYNTRVDSIPSNLVAGMFGFQSADFFKLEKVEEAAVPKVDVTPGGKD